MECGKPDFKSGKNDRRRAEDFRNGCVKAITIYAAYQYFEEQEKGSIACGKYADFVVLDQNPLEVPKEQLDQIKVRMTIKENEVIYRNGETDHE